MHSSRGRASSSTTSPNRSKPLTCLDAFQNASATGKGVAETVFAIADQRRRRAKRAAAREIVAAEEPSRSSTSSPTAATALHAAAIHALAASIVKQSWPKRGGASDHACPGWSAPRQA